MNIMETINTTDTPRTDAVPKRYMTVVYEIVDETEWRKTNPLRYEHNGLSAVTVSAYDAIELLDEAEAEVERLRELLTEASYRIQEPAFVKEIEDALAAAQRAEAFLRTIGQWEEGK